MCVERTIPTLCRKRCEDFPDSLLHAFVMNNVDRVRDKRRIAQEDKRINILVLTTHIIRIL